MFRLVLQTVRERKAGFVGAFIALLGASTLITAFGIILQSGIGDGVPVQRYADASVVISGKQSVTVHEGKKSKTKPLTDPVAVPADLVGTVAHTDGVARAVAVVSFPAQVVGADGRLVTGADDRRSIGANWSSAALGPFTLSGRGPRRAEEIVLEQSVAERAKAKLGDTVRIASTRAASPYTVVGIVKYTGAGGALRTPPVFFTDDTATTLFGRADQISAIGVLATPGTGAGQLDDRIDAALKGAGVSSHIGAGRSSAENPDVASARGTLKVLAGSLGGTVVLITMLVVGSTLALGVHQRRRELALLRAIGATPKQIHKMIAGEVLVVALAGSLLGCLPGVLAAEALRGALSVIGVLPQDFVFSYGPIPMAVAVAIGVITAQAAGFAVARRVVAIRPVEALSQAATEQPGLGRARVVFGTVLLVLGAAASLLPLFFGSVFAVAGAGSGGLIMVIAFLMLAPPLVAHATRLLAAPFRRRFGNLGYLAVANTRANARRLAAGIGPLILAIGFASLQLFIPTTTAAAANDQARAGVLADYTLTGDAGGLPTDAVADARALPGVAAVAGVVRVDLYSSVKMLGDPEVFDYQAEGLTTDGQTTDGQTTDRLTTDRLGQVLGQVLNLDVTGGDLSRLSETTAAISDGAAATLGTRVGGTVRIHLPDGQTIQPQVVATYRRGLGFGDITLSAQTLMRHSSHRLYDSILVRLQPGADHKTALAELKALSTRYPGLHVQDKGGLSAAQQRTAMVGLIGSAIPLLLIFGYIAIAVANTLVMTTLSRAREFALLRLVGATPAQVLRMMRTETLMVVLIAVAVGTLVPMLPLTMVSLGLTGSPVPSIPPLLYLAIVAATSALAAAAVLIPTRLALRARPIEAIGLRE
ncbi:FtsX-like permease family protein [Catenulispora sp. NL8]|uniref:FtsX-like permease family protein n=1 Tax=Catenulispora pinistramenti TaxID=2705254 RepID=A0ABS5KRH2_9ACTN|nr:FtsX-like permease family protein [Catenulispora pinistramenti]MBS2548652.1 FtsX-like permease family protein [Catenulispora pinistramenti]